MKWQHRSGNPLKDWTSLFLTCIYLDCFETLKLTMETIYSIEVFKQIVIKFKHYCRKAPGVWLVCFLKKLLK